MTGRDDAKELGAIAARTDVAVGLLAIVYVAAAVWWMGTGALHASTLGPFLVCLVAAAATRAAARSGRHGLPAWARAAWPIAVAPSLYVAQAAVIELERVHFVDAWFASLDAAFGLHHGFPAWPLGDPLEELASVIYLSYYGIPLLLLGVGARYGVVALARASHALAVSSLVAGVIWLGLPTGGYHETGGPLAPAWGPATALCRAIYESHPHFAAAFPSQHVAHAAAITGVLRALGAPRAVWVWVGAMWWATVHGQYHFAADGLAGWGLGAAAAWMAVPATRAARQPATRPLAHS